MRFGQVCKMTRKPRRWGYPHCHVVTIHCLHGECMACNAPYIVRPSKLYPGVVEEMWANEYSLCFNTTEDELLDYGTYEGVP